MNLGFDFRRGPEFLPDSLEYLTARVNTLWAKEHDPTSGKHTNITANSITVTGDLTVGGDIISGGGSVGPVTDYPNLTITSDEPWLKLTDTNAAANTRTWQLASDNGTFTLDRRQDDGSLGTRVLTIQQGPGALTSDFNTSMTLRADPSSSVALRFRARVGDNLTHLVFRDETNVTTLFAMAATGSATMDFKAGAGVYALTMGENKFYPSHQDLAYLGLSTNRFAWVWSANYSANNDAGYFFEGNTSFGMSFVGSASIAIKFGSYIVYYVSSSGYCHPSADATIYWGHPSVRWHTVYSANGVSTSSDGRLKIEHGETPLGLDFICRLKPVQYRWRREPTCRMRHGLVAQQVIDALAGVEFDGVDGADGDRYGLNYSELIAPIIKAIQELAAKVDDAKADTQRH